MSGGSGFDISSAREITCFGASIGTSACMTSVFWAFSSGTRAAVVLVCFAGGRIDGWVYREAEICALEVIVEV